MFRKQSAKMNEKTGDRGFTLLEVLISIAIFSTSMLAIAELQAVSIKGNVVSYRIAEASGWAANQVEILKAVPYASLASGQAAKERYTIDWNITDGVINNTKDITVTVTWKAGGKVKRVLFNAIRAG